MAKQPVDRWRYATSGLELVGILLVCIAIGYWIDHEAGSEPWGVLIGAVIGIVGGLFRFIWDAMRDQR